MAQDVTINVTVKMIEDVNKKVDEINKNFNKLNKEKLSGIKNSVDGLKQSTGKVHNALLNLRAGIGNVSKQIGQSFRNALRSAGSQLLAFGAAFLGFQAIRGIIRDFREFEKAVLEVTTLLPKSQQNVESISTSLRELSLEFGRSKVEQAKALYTTISSGFQDAAEAAKVLRTANKLALGGVTDVQTAVGGLTAILKSYNVNVDESERISDILFATMRNARTTIGELSAELNKVTSFGSQLNVRFEELSAALGALTLDGTDTATAAVQLRQILSSILKPTSEARKEAQRLGIDFSVAGLQAKGLGGFLNDLSRQLANNQEGAAKLFGNVRALAGILKITSNDLSNYNRLLRDNENSTGETAEAANKMKQSLDFKLNQLTEQLKALGEELVKTFLPAIRTGIDLLKDFAKAIRGVEDPLKDATQLGIAEVALEKQLEVLKQIEAAFPNIANANKDIKLQYEKQINDQKEIVDSLQKRVLLLRKIEAEGGKIIRGFYKPAEQLKEIKFKVKSEVEVGISGRQIANNLVSFIKQAFLSGDVKGAVASVFNKSGNLILQIIGAAIEILGQSEEKFRKMARGVFQTAASLPTQIVRNLGVLLDEFFRDIPNALRSAFEAIRELGPSITDAILRAMEDERLAQEIGTAAAEGIATSFADPRFTENLAKAIGKSYFLFFTKVFPTITVNFFKRLYELFNEFGRQISDRITNPDLWAAVAAALSTQFVYGLSAVLAPTLAEAILSTIVATAIATAIAGAIVKFVGPFVKGLTEQINRLLSNLNLSFLTFDTSVFTFKGAVDFLVNKLQEILKARTPAPTPALPTGGGGLGIKLPGFQEGFDVPKASRFANDNFPAALSAGESVLTSNTSDRLNDFLDSESNRGPMTIILQIGERQLSEVLVDLNQKGFRTA